MDRVQNVTSIFSSFFNSISGSNCSIRVSFEVLIILSKTSRLDTVHNLVLFAVYLCYLFYNNTSFRDVYFNKLVEEHKKNPNQNFLDRVIENLKKWKNVQSKILNSQHSFV